jgi:hypothetical protein
VNATTQEKAARDIVAMTVRLVDTARPFRECLIEVVDWVEQLVMKLAQGNFETVEQKLESTLRKQLPAERLKSAWQATQAQAGSFKEQAGARTFQSPTAELVIVSMLST